jgi:hypothetical protein
VRVEERLHDPETVMCDQGLAHLSRYCGAWRICGLEPQMQLQHLAQDFQDVVKEVPGTVGGMLGNTSGGRRGVEGPSLSTGARRKKTAPWQSRYARVAYWVGLLTVFVVYVVATSMSHYYEPLL